MTSRTTTLTTTHHLSTQLNMPSTTSSSNHRKATSDHLINQSHPLTRRRSARRSNDTSTTENTSFGSIVIQPTQNGYHHHHQDTTPPPTKKRKTNRTPINSDSDSNDHQTTSILQNQQNHLSHSHHSTSKHKKLGSSQPTVEDTTHTPHHHSKNRHKPYPTTLANTTTNSRPKPIPVRQTSGVFTFTTKRFQTPAKQDSSFSADENQFRPTTDSPIEPRLINGHRSGRDNLLNNDLRVPDLTSSHLNTSHDTRHSQNSYQRDPKGKGKANGQPNDRPNNRPRSNRHLQSPPVSPDRIENGRFTPDSPPTRTRTPKTSKKHPNIYGKKDKTVDGEMPLVMAETPMQIKNKHFRQTGRRDDPNDSGDVVESGSSSSSRRASGASIDRRGGRASSIGNGHEALPHPRVPSDCLHRHIQLDLPPIVRCRTLLSWTSQKADDITKLSLSETFEPSRISFEALPSPVTASVRGLIGRHSNLSKLRIKVIEEVVSKVVKGVCTNQLDLSWFDASDQSLDPPVMHSRNQHTESIDDLPPNPQDLLNQAKARDLENWRQRLSYEDGARQYELNRYSTLLSRLSSSSTRLDDQEQEEIKLDKKTLEDLGVTIQIGRRLRKNDTDHQEDVIDVSKEVKGNWINAHSQLSILTEKVEILKDKTIRIENESEQQFKEMTQKLKLMEISEEKRKVERKLKLISGTEGEETEEEEEEEGGGSKEERLGWCLDRWDGFFDKNGKRDLLRSISRTLDD